MASEASSPAQITQPADHHRPFGGDTFGVQAERFARFFGTPTFIIGQSAVVVLWIVLNALAITDAIAWDKYPFIALNLAFSLQAAYAAPLILLAQTRQADRDKIRDEKLTEHREAEMKRTEQFEARQAELLSQDKTMAEQHSEMLAQNTALTEQVAALTTELHRAICAPGGAVQGGAAQGGTAQGGSLPGGSARGGAAQGGSARGSAARGSAAQGGPVQGGPGAGEPPAQG